MDRNLFDTKTHIQSPKLKDTILVKFMIPVPDIGVACITTFLYWETHYRSQFSCICVWFIKDRGEGVVCSLTIQKTECAHITQKNLTFRTCSHTYNGVSTFYRTSHSLQLDKIHKEIMWKASESSLTRVISSLKIRVIKTRRKNKIMVSLLWCFSLTFPGLHSDRTESWNSTSSKINYLFDFRMKQLQREKFSTQLEATNKI